MEQRLTVKGLNLTHRKSWREFIEIILLALILAIFIRSVFLGVFRISTSTMEPTLQRGDLIFVSKISYGLRIPFVGYQIGESLPERGDLVLFRHPEQNSEFHIKRVIGLPGDHIRIKGRTLFVNERPYQYTSLTSESFKNIRGGEFMHFYLESNGERSYQVMYATEESSVNPKAIPKKSSKSEGAKGESIKEIGPLIVPPGEIFLMGDNRDASADSRYWGSLPLRSIEGRVVSIWFSMQWPQGNQGSSWSSIRWDRMGFIQ